MQKVFTANLSRAQIRSTFYTKKFGLFTATKINKTGFRFQQIYELLYWFELELTDHKIANRLQTDYQRVHRFYMRVRERLREYEEDSITLLDGYTEPPEICTPARCTLNLNWNTKTGG